MRAFWNRSWPALLLTASTLSAWECAARGVASPSFPPFTMVIEALVRDAGQIMPQVLYTLGRASVGLVAAVVTMVPLGILIGRIRWLSEVLEPIIELLRPLPPPALAPLVMLFLGNGDIAKISVIYYAAALLIVIHAIEGIRGTHPLLHTVSRSLRLRRHEALWSVDLPASLPVIMTGIRLAVAAALMVSVTAEMLLSTNGIGTYLLRSQETFHIADAMAGICVIALVGWAINAGFMILTRRLLHWHHAATADE